MQYKRIYEDEILVLLKKNIILYREIEKDGLPSGANLEMYVMLEMPDGDNVIFNKRSYRDEWTISDEIEWDDLLFYIWYIEEEDDKS